VSLKIRCVFRDDGTIMSQKVSVLEKRTEQKMKAMVITGFGGPEVFVEREMPKPTPKFNELLVKVYATSINPVDFKIRQAGSWVVKPPCILGWDVSGVVEAIGEGARDFKVGDEVFYTPHLIGSPGTYAEYHVVPQDIVVRKPVGLSHVEAAAIPLAGCTAWDALMLRTKIQLGETVLIHGAGGVGSFAIQIAKAAGARVLVTSGPAMVEECRTLGADLVINYKAEDYSKVLPKEIGGEGVDVVFDTVGGDTIAKSIPLVKRYGRMAGIAGLSGDLSGAQPKNLTIHMIMFDRSRSKMEALRTLVNRKQLRPVIDSVLPLEKVADAHRRLEAGGVKGKIVLQIVKS
jgi:NADPH2:quinone reductase